jgi:hypothetical protein
MSKVRIIMARVILYGLSDPGKRQMPKQCRVDGKLPTHQIGEKDGPT